MAVPSVDSLDALESAGAVIDRGSALHHFALYISFAFHHYVVEISYESRDLFDLSVHCVRTQWIQAGPVYHHNVRRRRKKKRKIERNCVLLGSYLTTWFRKVGGLDSASQRIT